MKTRKTGNSLSKGRKVRDLSSKRKVPTLSACMMVRDEEENLPRCLQSIQGFVDEIIVVDTGSKDRTVEIAESFGAKVFHHPWENDFSKHRNQSISYATGDWVFIIDADEELFLQMSALGFKQKLSIVPPDMYAGIILMKDIHHQQSIMEFNTARFFRRGKIVYKGIIHNQPQIVGGGVFIAGLYLHHYGYDISPERKKQKFERTHSGLMERLKANPQDWSCYFYLSQIHADAGDNQKCVECGEEYVKHKEELKSTGDGNFNRSIYFTVIHNYMKIGDQKKAYEWLMEGLKEVPGDIDLSLAAVEYGVWAENYEMVQSAAKDYVSLYKQYKQNPAAKLNRFIYSLRPEALAYCTMHLSVSSLKGGMEALKLFNETLKDTRPEFQQGIIGLLKQQMEEHKIPIQMNVHSPNEKTKEFPQVNKPMYRTPMGLTVPKIVGIGGN